MTLFLLLIACWDPLVRERSEGRRIVLIGLDRGEYLSCRAALLLLKGKENNKQGRLIKTSSIAILSQTGRRKRRRQANIVQAVLNDHERKSSHSDPISAHRDLYMHEGNTPPQLNSNQLRHRTIRLGPHCSSRIYCIVSGQNRGRRMFPQHISCIIYQGCKPFLFLFLDPLHGKTQSQGAKQTPGP